jgi:hypothetical protein
MDNDSSKPAGGGPSGNGLATVLLTLLMGAMLIHQIPLTDSRPSEVEPKTYSYVAADIDARLWQDPIGAVARGVTDVPLKGKSLDSARADHSAARLARDVAQQLSDPDHPPPIFVGVLVPGGAYTGDAEWRRRARYAVLSGLKAFGYAPHDPEHIGYFTPDGGLDAALNTNGEARPATAAPFVAYEWFDQLKGSSSPAAAATGAAATAGGEHRLVVLWLDQRAFGDQTVLRIDRLFSYLLGQKAGGSDRRLIDPAAAGTDLRKPRVIILGPGDSTTLKKMAEDAANSTAVPANDLQFYDYGATARDAELLPEPNAGPKRLPEFIDRKRLAVFRTIGDDQQLACVLRDELALRHISAPTTHKPPPFLAAPEVVLISEWDTDYGRTLSGITKDVLTGTVRCPDDHAGAAAAASEMVPAHWLESFSYLRGLDGRLSVSTANASDSTDGSSRGRDEKTSSTAAAGDDKRIERPEGQGQLDYLRRLAARMQTMDRTARAGGEKGILAIGVLGSDVYDKLIVLQALHSAFPDALFFTTDLDARMLHPSQLDWTRNLLVASSFGLELAPALQDGIPPFRDAYQTSLYLSTLIALTNVTGEPCLAGTAAGSGPCFVDQGSIDKWLAQPRLFEIGRHGPFDLSRATDGRYMNIAAAAATADPVSQCGTTGKLLACVSVHPPTRGLSAKPGGSAWRISFVVVTLGLIGLALFKWGVGGRIQRWAVGPTSGDAARRPQERERQLLAMVAGGVLALCALTYALPTVIGRIADFLTEGGRGVPLNLLEGVSLWPTELIRALALVLAIWLAYRAWRNLDANLGFVSEQMKWPRERKALIAKVDVECARWTPWLRVLHMFSFKLNWLAPAAPPARDVPTADSAQPQEINLETGLSAKAERFWHRYIYQGRIGARLTRVVTAVLLYMLFAFAVAAIFGFQNNSIRGDLASNLDRKLIFVAVLATQFLIFFVVDATLLCVQFINAVAGRKSSPEDPPEDDFDSVSVTTRWPQKTLDHFGKKLNVELRYVDQWVTIHVIGLRTKAVSKLIFYPYIILSLIIVARSPIFDNWRMPLTLMIILGASVAIVTVSALLLRTAAEYARRKAIWRLGNELIQLSKTGPHHPQPDAERQATAKQVELMITQIAKYNTGSFASYLDQPVVRALLLPLGSVGGVGALQYLTMWNF